MNELPNELQSLYSQKYKYKLKYYNNNKIINTLLTNNFIATVRFSDSCMLYQYVCKSFG